MAKYEIQIGDQVRDMTDEEIVQRKKDLAEMKALEQAAADRKALKEATLAKLGLTADEVAALLS